METTENKIPNYVFEDLLFKRRLERNLNAEQGKLNALLAEHVRLLAERKALMDEVHDSVQQRLKDEEAPKPDIHSEPEAKEVSDGN